jgi:hypothetical protein
VCKFPEKGGHGEGRKKRKDGKRENGEERKFHWCTTASLPRDTFFRPRRCTTEPSVLIFLPKNQITTKWPKYLNAKKVH